MVTFRGAPVFLSTMRQPGKLRDAASAPRYKTLRAIRAHTRVGDIDALPILPDPICIFVQHAIAFKREIDAYQPRVTAR